jgi:hypothetical protein
MKANEQGRGQGRGEDRKEGTYNERIKNEKGGE